MSDEPQAFVLDSYALLVLFQKEPGYQIVQEVLEREEKKKTKAFLSVINLGEIAYITERKKDLSAARKVLAVIDRLPIIVLPANKPTVLRAAHLKALHPISYCDAFAAATAIETGGTLLTGDPEFRPLAKAGLFSILWLPQKQGK